MAKSVVLGILMETLGEYVDISREKLKMAVWSGEIQLRDLQLKSSALSSLDLPVCVLRGSVASLKIAIPWKNLGKSPTVIQVDGLIAIIGPSDDKSFTSSDLQRHSSDLKRRILERAEKIAYAYISGELQKKELSRMAASAMNKKKAKNTSWITSLGVSYAQGVLAKMLANIELKFRDIHIRYEDCAVIPGFCIQAGITIAEIFVVTTDEDWFESSASNNSRIKRRANGNGSIMYKTATLRNLAVYWNTDSKISLANSEDGSYEKADWMTRMMGLIYNEKNKTVDSGNQYIILPPNHIEIQLAHNDEHLSDNTSTAASASNLPQNDADNPSYSAQRYQSCRNSLPIGVSCNRNGEGTVNVEVSECSIDKSDKSPNIDDDQYLSCLADVRIDMGQLQIAFNGKQLDQVRIMSEIQLKYKCEKLLIFAYPFEFSH